KRQGWTRQDIESSPRLGFVSPHGSPSLYVGRAGVGWLGPCVAGDGRDCVSTATRSSQQGRGPRGAGTSTSLPVGFTSLIAFGVGSESDSSVSASITASVTGTTQNDI